MRKLYVDSLGTSKAAEEVRARLIRRLRGAHGLQITENEAVADAVAKGTGQIWTTGSVLLGPRPNSPSQPMYEGFLSVEVIGKGNQTLWSYLVTPSKFHWGGIADDLAKQLAERLLGAMEASTQPTAAALGSTDTARAQLNGAGATFPEPLYRKWFESFRQEHPEVKIGYDAVGSGEGIRRLKAGKVDFGASEIPLTDEQAAAGSLYLQVPVVMGAVVPIYNLPGVRQNLNLTPEALAGIYLGKIKKWNDPAISQANHGLNLPAANIVVVHRSDGSGTSFVWSDYLSKVSLEWKTTLGSGATVSWPVGTGAEYNDGVAAAVQSTPNSIGYVEFIYAIQHELKFAAVKNAAGEFVKANIASVTAASAAWGAQGSGFRRSITDAPGKSAYPIATYTWLMLASQSEDKNKATALRDLVHWMLTSGQKSCSALGYAPLPAEVAQRALEMVR